MYSSYSNWNSLLFMGKWNHRSATPRRELRNRTICMLLQFSHSVVSDSSWPHGLQHTRLPCPSLCPRVCSNSCPLSQWCCLTISFSAIPFSFCLQSFPASGSFPMSWLFTSGGRSIGASASTSVLPVDIQDWSALSSPNTPPPYSLLTISLLSVIYVSVSILFVWFFGFHIQA